MNYSPERICLLSAVSCEVEKILVSGAASGSLEAAKQTAIGYLDKLVTADQLTNDSIVGLVESIKNYNGADFGSNTSMERVYENIATQLVNKDQSLDLLKASLEQMRKGRHAQLRLKEVVDANVKVEPMMNAARATANSMLPTT